MPLLGQLRVIRWFWRLCPLAQRIPGFLYMIDIPFWCYIERTCLMILCCLVTVQITGLKTGFIFCSASFSKSNMCLKIEDVILLHYGVTQLYKRQRCSSYKTGPWQISLYSPRYLHSPMRCQQITALSAYALVCINVYAETTLHQPQVCFQLAA